MSDIFVNTGALGASAADVLATKLSVQDNRFKEINKGISRIDDRLLVFDARLEGLNNRLEEIEKTMNTLVNLLQK